MARMLRVSTGSEFGCCDACDHHAGGGKRGGRKARKRERSMARAREKEQFKRDYGI